MVVVVDQHYVDCRWNSRLWGT